MRFFSKLLATERVERGFGSTESPQAKIAHVIPEDEDNNNTIEHPPAPTKKSNRELNTAHHPSNTK
eukprot:13259505-Ditylum_brightwellii.AAC.1